MGSLNLVHLFRFSLPLSAFGPIFLFLHLRDHKPTAPFTTVLHQTPRSSAMMVIQSLVVPNCRRSSATQSVHSFSFPPGPRFPAFSSSPDLTLLGNLWSPMRSSAPDHNNLLVPCRHLQRVYLTFTDSLRIQSWSQGRLKIK